MTAQTVPAPGRTSPTEWVKDAIMFLVFVTVAAVGLNLVGVINLGGPKLADLISDATKALSKQAKVTVPVPGTKLTPAPSGKFVGPSPSAIALRTIPPQYVQLCQKNSVKYRVDWRLCSVLATESDYGRSNAAGVHSGLNFAGCCVGPGQFNLKGGANTPWTYVKLPAGQSYRYKADGTWGIWKVDGDKDGVYNPYDPDDAVASTFRYLAAEGATSRKGWVNALWHYNHDVGYGQRIIARALTYGASR